MNQHIQPVPLEKAYRLLTHGPTVLVSAHHAGIDNVMAAAWACALDFALMRLGASGMPYVAGCAARLECRLVPEPHNQQTYDSFIGEVAAAWADDHVFRNGHWAFEEAGPAWRSIHHVAGGHFHAIGEAMAARLTPRNKRL